MKLRTTLTNLVSILDRILARLGIIEFIMVHSDIPEL